MTKKCLDLNLPLLSATLYYYQMFIVPDSRNIIFLFSANELDVRHVILNRTWLYNPLFKLKCTFGFVYQKICVFVSLISQLKVLLNFIIVFVIVPIAHTG